MELPISSVCELAQVQGCVRVFVCVCVFDLVVAFPFIISTCSINPCVMSNASHVLNIMAHAPNARDTKVHDDQRELKEIADIIKQC